MLRFYSIAGFSLLFSFCFSFSATAQLGLPNQAGARGAAMGGTGVTFTDVYSGFRNQAGLAYLEDLSFGVYGETRFLGVGIPAVGFVAAYPNEKIGTFGLAVQHFGTGAYNEQKIGLAYARKLFDRMSIGVQFDYFGVRMAEYGSASAVTFEAGILAEVSDEWRIGIHAYSPVRIKLPNQDYLPALFSVGASYLPSDKVTVTAELEKNIDYPLNARIGIEYQPMEVLALRGGVSTAPFSMNFGLGMRLNGLGIDLATMYHEVLGFTPGISISYGLKKAAK